MEAGNLEKHDRVLVSHFSLKKNRVDIRLIRRAVRKNKEKKM